MLVRALTASGGGTSGGEGKYGSFNPTNTSVTTTDFGFAPTKIVLWTVYGGTNSVATILVELSNGAITKITQWLGTAVYDSTSSYAPYIKFNGTTLSYQSMDRNFQNTTYYLGCIETS